MYREQRDKRDADRRQKAAQIANYNEMENSKPQKSAEWAFRRKRTVREVTVMHQEQIKKLDKIIMSYGVDSQVDMAVEECSELIKALMKYRRNSGTTAREAVIDELADVQIMLEQMKIIFFCESEVNQRIDYKIRRQIERIELGI